MMTTTIHEHITRAARTWHQRTMFDQDTILRDIANETGMPIVWLWQRIDEESRTATNTASDNPARKY